MPVTYPDGTTAALRVAAIFDHPDKMGPARAACTVDTRIRVLANTGALACTPRRLTTWPLS